MPGAFFCGECGSSTRTKLNLSGSQRTDTRELRLEADSPGIPEKPSQPQMPIRRFADETPSPLADISPFLGVPDTAESIVEPVRPFTLDFSNGDTISIAAGGLLGRNPIAGPGEAHEHLIIVTDPDRTVSKTHLEFGIEAGDFWVADRFSGNGTAIVERGKPPRRLVPGRRYRVERGSRVSIGEQSFTVS
jgi:hypothetical protein